MTVSAIGQGMSMSMLYGMQKPSASDIVSKILGNLDTDGDGALSTEEIGKAGKFAKQLLKADANGDGIVTQDELLSDITKKMGSGMMPLMGMQPLSADDMASQIIKELDTNGDGVLSADEISKTGKRAQNIIGADANGDGVVTKDELTADIQKNMASRQAHMHHHGAGAIAAKIMDELDTNGDGSLSTDEINSSGSSAQIQPADTNGDGVVSMAELIAYLTNNQAANIASSSETQGQLNSLV
jgi:Ca2+-binding EF-hand superfamily protein